MKKVVYAASTVAIAAVLGLGGLAYKAARKQPTLALDEAQSRQEQNAERAEQLESAISKSVKELRPSRQPASEKAQAAQNSSFSGKESLTEYVKMKSQIVMSAQMRERKNELLHDEAFLKGLGKLLKTPALNDLKTKELQSQAIDLLVEARTSTDGRVAGEVLKSVIEDKSIESDRLKLAERKALAGLKAELLYQWSAQEPKVADSILSWLPGPVSQKIWRNVLAAQEQNELASSQELQNRRDAR